jgi:ADP-ribose pyrophosphatase YjhB (NUDIX family)
LKTPNLLSRTGVYGIAIQNGKLLVIKQKKGPFIGKFDLPGGKIEPQETIEEALRREFREEVGLAFHSFQLMGNGAATTQVAQMGAPYVFHQIGLFYQVNGLTPLCPQHELESFWIDLDELATLPIAPLLKQSLNLLFAIFELRI